MPADDGPHDPDLDSDLESFLRDLRALRERAGLSIPELADRAHFPSETLAAAETAPVKPTMPVLEAYVRACGAPPEPWEDRWRNLSAPDASPPSPTGPDPADPSPTRPGPGRADPSPTGLDVLGLAPGGAPTMIADPAVSPPAPVRPGRLIRRLALGVAFAALVGGGAVALLRPAGQPARISEPRTPRSSASDVPGAPSSPPVALTPPPSAPAPSPSTHSRSAAVPVVAAPRPERPAAPSWPPAPRAAIWRLVVGVGCPGGRADGVILDAAAKGPGWTPAGGGWTGDGCDGSSVWTMGPNGNQPVPSALTWFFTPGPRFSRCTLAIFVPTQNALGPAEYAISAPGASLGTVPVAQAAAAGRWVTLGTFLATGPLYIQLAPAVTTLTAAIPGAGNPGNPGNPGDPGKPHGHTHQTPPGHNSAVAASAASATCTR